MSSSPNVPGQRNRPSNVSYQTITSLLALSPIDTSKVFIARSPGPFLSPIDSFIENTNAINRLYLNVQPITKELSALVVLGYVSAIESYLRGLTRGLINVDEHSRRLAEPLNVSFAAALYHDADLLPEALIENRSLAGQRELEELIKDIFGVKGQLPNDVKLVLEQFRKVCEIRHCCVHRFGRLGTKNALNLGLEQHKNMLEGDFAPTQKNLEEISDIVRTTAKTINNFVFREVMKRTAKKTDGVQYSWRWVWNYQKDRARFLAYYKLFSSAKDSPPSPVAKDVYVSLRAEFK